LEFQTQQCGYLPDCIAHIRDRKTGQRTVGSYFIALDADGISSLPVELACAPDALFKTGRIRP
jgi:hypothetical protein